MYGHLLDKIETDCLKLKKQKKLTEYGQGQLDLVRMLKKSVCTSIEKYYYKDILKIPPDSRSAFVGIMIANELHNLREVLKKKG